MRKAFTSKNIKQGKFVFRFINKRDFTILICCLVASFFYLATIGGGENFYHNFVIILVLNALVFIVIMPMQTYQSLYIYLYYLIRYLRSKKDYINKGVCYIWQKENGNE